MKDFSNYKFRASQMYKLMSGNIGLSPTEENDLKGFIERKIGAIEGRLDLKGKPYKPLPDGYAKKLEELLDKKKANALPKGIKTELKKIFRAETYNRNFVFTNKFVQKGIQQEEEGVTLYQLYREQILGIKTYFKTNINVKVHLKNDENTGTPDLVDTNDFDNCNEGFDIKCSWSLESFPFAEDELDATYEWQNRTYMNLTNTKKWTTVYCLVNATEQQVFNEKQKHFYALGMPDQDDKYWAEYIRKCRDIEKMLIFDYDRFIDRYNASLEISREEWFSKGYDIPLADRVVEKVVYFDEIKSKEMSSRVKVGRKYLIELQENGRKGNKEIQK